MTLAPLTTVIAQALGIDEAEVSDDTSMQNCDAWDSLRHFHLILSLEQAYGVRFSSDRIPGLTSVQALRDELARLDSRHSTS
jgi:acyl carrier protein